MSLTAQIALYLAAALITAGGLYDVLVPRLPDNLVAQCGSDGQALKLVRELLRALGGALIAIGVTVAMLVFHAGVANRRWTVVTVLVLVLPSEAINSFGMRRVGSPFWFPLIAIGVTLLGAGFRCTNYLEQTAVIVASVSFFSRPRIFKPPCSVNSHSKACGVNI